MNNRILFVLLIILRNTLQLKNDGQINPTKKIQESEKIDNPFIFCLSIEDFNKKYKKELQNKNLSDVFGKKGKFQGEGDFAKVKKIPFFWEDQKLDQNQKIILIQKEWASVKFQTIPKNNSDLLNKIEKEIYYLKKFSEFPKFQTLFKFINCAYIENPKSQKISFYIVSEALKKNLNSGEKFFQTIKKSERINHYKKLFQDLSLFHKNNVGHSDIKPENILSTDIINQENNFNLKIIDYGIMENLGQKMNHGTKIYLPPWFFYKDKTVSKERDIYAMLLSVYNMEFGYFEFEIHFQENLYCFRSIYERDNKDIYIEYKKNCFDKLLESVYHSHIDHEKKFFSVFYRVIGSKVSGEKDYLNYLGKNVGEQGCDSIMCFLLNNLKFKKDEYRSIEDIIIDLEKLVRIETLRENKEIL